MLRSIVCRSWRYKSTNGKRGIPQRHFQLCIFIVNHVPRCVYLEYKSKQRFIPYILLLGLSSILVFFHPQPSYISMSFVFFSVISHQPLFCAITLFWMKCQSSTRHTRMRTNGKIPRETWRKKVKECVWNGEEARTTIIFVNFINSFIPTIVSPHRS